MTASACTSSSLEQGKQEAQEMELKDLERAERALLSPTSTKYSLTSPAPLSSSRRPSYVFSTSSSSHKSPWQGQVDLDHRWLPSINPSDHIRTLLFQLVSSISSMKAAFTHLQATLRVYSSAEDARMVPSPAEKVMVEELQRLSSLHTRLYCVLQEHGAMKEDRLGSPDSTGTDNYSCGDTESLLKSYEGVISRFHEEITMKDAVVEALKETLAKSMLKGEKLERRVKTLEAKLSLK